jgi:hypothetical protein
MGNSNLPPGVSEGMIPGNRPEDLEEEAFWDRFDVQLREKMPHYAAVVDEIEDQMLSVTLSDGQEWMVEEAITGITQLARDMGYEKGIDDERLAHQMDEATSPPVHVDDDGHIYLRDHRISQKEAIDIAYELAYAVRKSQDRNQIGTPHYHSSQAILARDETPLGRAILALRKVF